MNNPVRFRLPAGCPRCAHKTHQVPAIEMIGEAVVLTWHCQACAYDWSIRRREHRGFEHRASDGDARPWRGVERRAVPDPGSSGNRI